MELDNKMTWSTIDHCHLVDSRGPQSRPIRRAPQLSRGPSARWAHPPQPSLSRPIRPDTPALALEQGREQGRDTHSTLVSTWAHALEHPMPHAPCPMPNHALPNHALPNQQPMAMPAESFLPMDAARTGCRMGC